MSDKFVALSIKDHESMRLHNYCRQTIFRGVLTIVVCVFTISYVNAIDYRFRHYTVDEGLSSNTIRCVIQDRTGYIWAGTTDGLCRLAGSEIKIFRHDPQDTNSIDANWVLSLFEDSRGQIWVGSVGGIYIYDVASENFKPMDRELVKPIIADNIVEDSNGDIWLSDISRGMFRYHQKNGAFTHYNRPKDPVEVTGLITDHLGKVLSLGSNGTYVCVYDQTQDEFIKFDNSSNTKEYSYSKKAMCEDSQGNIWVAGQFASMFKLDRQKGHLTAVYSEKQYNVLRVHCIMEYKQGVLFLGTNNGILLYDYVKNKFEKIDCHHNDITGLNDQFIFSMLKDRENGIWFGTYFGGLNYLSPTSSLFSLYGKISTGKRKYNYIASKFCEDSDGSIWIGSDNGGLVRLNPRTQEITPVIVDKNRPDLNIHGLNADNNYLWVGTYLDGIYRMDRKTGESKNYKYPQSSTFFLRDSYGILWVGSPSGMWTYNQTEDRFDHKFRTKNNRSIFDAVDDKDGNLWFASNGDGLLMWNSLNRTLTHYIDSDQSVKTTYFLRSLCYYKDRLWVGTAGHGLWYFDKESQSLQKESSVEFNFTTVQSIIPHNDKLWLTSNNGLAKYDVEKKRISWYTKESGLQGKSFNPTSGLKASDGKIYIGGNRGFNVFSPDELPDIAPKSDIAFTDFKILGQRVNIRAGGILESNINLQREVVLSSIQNSFTINFTALSFISPSDTKYYYKLEGAETEWIRVKSSNVVSVAYPHLPPGSYRFMVKTEDSQPLNMSDIDTIDIVILSPWYATLIMKLLYILLFSVGLALIIWRMRRRIEAKQLLQITEIKQKNNQDLLESKIRIFQEVAHEIRTPVTLIAAPVEEILNSRVIPPEIREDLNIIKNNSDRLVSLMNQVLDFSKLNSVNSNLLLKSVDVADTLSSIIDRFVCVARSNGIDIELKQAVNHEITAYIDIESFDKIVCNIVSNALKFAKDKIVITLDSNSPNTFSLIIWDNGKGIEDKRQIFDLFYTSTSQRDTYFKGFGIGLSVVNLLLKKMEATIDVNSEIDQYSEFIMTFPIGENNQEYGVDLPEDITAYESLSDNERETILIVEDHIPLRDFLAKSLRVNYNVRTASDGYQALEILDQPNVDIIICDLMMPRMNGIELCANIKNNIAINHIPIILLTADTNVDSKVRALENGADVYIEKPVEMKFLNAQILGILEKRKQLRTKLTTMPIKRIDTAKSQREEAFIAQINAIV